MKHWIERIADELKERDVEKHVIASGTSISGSIHIGNSCDVFIANAIGKKLKELGVNAETIWIADDHDPLRKVPYPLPESYDKYLGMPYSNIPCPEGCCSSFVEHFEKPLFDVLDDFGIELTPKSGFEMYKQGLYNDYIRISLEKAEEIRNIFNQYREHPLANDWLPYNPICDECGRVNTTYAYAFNEDTVQYRCDCGHDGEMDINSGNGKLTWRVEWAARWKIFKITCEPFGKDHAASGGSYDVSSIISKEIFNYTAPYPVPYEWITLDGEAMSKSKGVFFTPKQWLEIAPAESLNYFLFRSKPMKHKDFSPKMAFLDFIEQFDKVEKVYYNEEEAPSEKEDKKFRKIYEMSKIQENTEKTNLPFRPPYRFLTVAYQIAGEDNEKIFEILKKNSQLTDSFKNKEYETLSEIENEYFEKRVDEVKNWLEKYAPKFVKFQVMKNIPNLPLTDEQTTFLKELAILIEENDFNDAAKLHDEMYEILNKQGLKIQKAFQAIYKVVLGQKQGPKAASFLLSLDKDFVVKRLKLLE
ncbi:lysine--tRNA ligase [Methanobrevibacter filiformis]|uniref:Lysine--tRNA ligase n=1 Tax=Methanobrevibacter filiformis TaxID=55758 RepID=A0A166CWX7_9EURY|nr:lysine--tRNA ligase [Methanobrevibacter filiformis]KZX17357.1 lysine--tRNA ligase [Methanobrevibacter filiformis]